MSTPASCVVCGAALADAAAARYANDWERVRKRYPCCGDACATAFDPDVHWLPAAAPAATDDAETERLGGVMRRRLADGDSPRVVTREMLLAGVAISAIRKQLNDAVAAAGVARKNAA